MSFAVTASTQGLTPCHGSSSRAAPMSTSACSMATAASMLRLSIPQPQPISVTLMRLSPSDTRW